MIELHSVAGLKWFNPETLVVDIEFYIFYALLYFPVKVTLEDCNEEI